MISGKITDILIDENGNYQVVTEYRKDDDTLLHKGTSGRYVFRPNETTDQLVARINADIGEHCEALVIRSYGKQRNINGMVELKSKLVTSKIFKDFGIVKMPGKKFTIHDADGMVTEENVPLL